MTLNYEEYDVEKY